MGPKPTDRAKNALKRSRLVRKDGGTPAITITGANVSDAKLLAQTIQRIVLERPDPEPDYSQRLCLDKGYDNEDGWGACVDHEYVPQAPRSTTSSRPAPRDSGEVYPVVDRATLAPASHERLISDAT